MNKLHIHNRARSRYDGNKRMTQLPDVDELMKASRVYEQQLLAVYQQLYFAGLTDPGFPATPFGVRRNPEHELCIQIVPYGYDQYAFNVGPHDLIESVLPKVNALMDAINDGRKLVDPRACCPVAVERACVCLASFSCTVHGSRCFGSHD